MPNLCPPPPLPIVSPHDVEPCSASPLPTYHLQTPHRPRPLHHPRHPHAHHSQDGDSAEASRLTAVAAGKGHAPALYALALATDDDELMAKAAVSEPSAAFAMYRKLIAQSTTLTLELKARPEARGNTTEVESARQARLQSAHRLQEKRLTSRRLKAMALDFGMRAANAGHAEACEEMGARLRGRDDTQAHQYFETAAATGSKRALAQLARAQWGGIGCDANEAAALATLKRLGEVEPREEFGRPGPRPRASSF